jgi:hypothetical protein
MNLNDILWKRGGMMKACARWLFALGFLLPALVFAETDLAGEWRGKLAVDATTSLPVQFTFTKKPDGSYSALLNSLENEYIKNVAASAVSLKDGALKVDVPALSGSYAGSLKDDHFEGQWSQAGSKPIPLTLTRPPQATKADLELLTGTWKGPAPGAANAVVIFEFKPDEKRVLTGVVSIPTQGATFPMGNLEIGPGTLSFRIVQISAEYRGTYSAAGIIGALKQGANNVPINLTKGDVAAAEKVYALKLTGEQFSALYGDWKGQVGGKDRVLHFTVGPGNSFAAFFDVVEAKARHPVTEATGTGKKIALKIAALQGEFTGELAGKTLAGQWTQGGQSTPVTFTKQ